ncbi:unnamed protein product, partial [Fusarium fujikuroi]
AAWWSGWVVVTAGRNLSTMSYLSAGVDFSGVPRLCVLEDVVDGSMEVSTDAFASDGGNVLHSGKILASSSTTAYSRIILCSSGASRLNGFGTLLNRSVLAEAIGSQMTYLAVRLIGFI